MKNKYYTTQKTNPHYLVYNLLIMFYSKYFLMGNKTMTKYLLK